jgi:ribonuclease HII
MASFKIERKILRQQFKTIAGVDEAGRGALFGPVVAAAVVLPQDWVQGPVRGWLKEVNDSKLLSPQKRRELAGRILAGAEAVGVGSATNREIDLINIYRASLRAMKRAVESLAVPPDYVLIDGAKGQRVELGCPRLCVPGGDRKSISIAAASILAKVLRDEMIIRLDGFFAGYHLAENKGYGTRAHYRALEVKGPTPLHRLSFNLEAKLTAHE